MEQQAASNAVLFLTVAPAGKWAFALGKNCCEHEQSTGLVEVLPEWRKQLSWGIRGFHVFLSNPNPFWSSLTEGCVELLSEGGAGGAEKTQISELEMVVFIAIVNWHRAVNKKERGHIYRSKKWKEKEIFTLCIPVSVSFCNLIYETMPIVFVFFFYQLGRGLQLVCCILRSYLRCSSLGLVIYSQDWCVNSFWGNLKCEHFKIKVISQLTFFRHTYPMHTHYHFCSFGYNIVTFYKTNVMTLRFVFISCLDVRCCAPDPDCCSYQSRRWGKGWSLIVIQQRELWPRELEI